MQLKYSVFAAISFTINIFVQLPLGFAQEQRLVFDGAVITSRGSVRAQSAINSGFAGILSKDQAVQSLGTGAVLLLPRSSARVRAASVTEEAPRPYSRKDDLCKSAKGRRLMKKIAGRARCEPNHAYFSTAVPNDTQYINQYASSWMSLPTAWDKTTGSDDLIALVIDTGVLYTHPDLSQNMWSNPAEIAGDGIDNDGNGYVDDVYGINAISNSGDPLDDNGHGTHCAGILGGRGNNSQGVAGVAWQTKIAAAKFLSSSGSGSLANAIKAINYGIALKKAGNNIVVSNNSWGGPSFSSTLAAAIQAAGNEGILFVAAAGNAASNNDTSPAYPASYSSDAIIAVASTTSTGALSSFSNYGATSVDIAAPGSSVISTYLNNNYAYLSGTSMAAPQVSGVALLVQSVCQGSLTHQQVKDAILATGQTYAGLQGKVATSAIVNANGAVTAAKAYCPDTPTPTSTPTPTATATATPSPTHTATEPTPAPTATAAPLPPTVIPTTPPMPVVIAPTATPTPTSRPGRRVRPQFSVSPGSVSGAAPIAVSLSDAGSGKSATLRIFGKDGSYTYACPRIEMPISNGAANVAVQLPESVLKMRQLQFFVTTGKFTIQSRLSVGNSTPANKYKDGRAAFLEVCKAVTSAITGKAARSRAARTKRA